MMLTENKERILLLAGHTSLTFYLLKVTSASLGFILLNFVSLTNISTHQIPLLEV